MELSDEPVIGRHVRLEPYNDLNREEVRAALDTDADAWALFSRTGQGEHFDQWWSDAQDAASRGENVNFAVRLLATGAVVGTTSYLGVSREHATVEIGATFYRPEARGGPVNPDCKRLLLGRAFEAGANRVQIVTDARNLRSQAAIAKLGAVREGVLRASKVTWTGHIRDTVVFSVVRSEWPDVRDRLDARLRSAGVSPARPA